MYVLKPETKRNLLAVSFYCGLLAASFRSGLLAVSFYLLVRAVVYIKYFAISPFRVLNTLYIYIFDCSHAQTSGTMLIL